MVAIASIWKSRVDKPMDTLIHSVHQVLLSKRRMLAAHRDQDVKAAPEDEHGDFARITLVRGHEFFQKAEAFLAELFTESVVTIVFDINHFKLYNDIFGRKAGNTYLENLADTVRTIAEKFDGICGYTGGDTFCVILPTEKRTTGILFRKRIPSTVCWIPRKGSLRCWASTFPQTGGSR